MDLRSRLIAPLGRPTPSPADPDAIDIDLGALVTRIILFEEYILDSIRLKEFTHLVRILGVDGVQALLQSGRMRICCDAFTVAEVGRTAVLGREPKDFLPYNSYAFGTIRMADQNWYVEDCLRNVHAIENLSAQQTNQLRETIVANVATVPEGTDERTTNGLSTDLQNNVPNIALAAATELSRRLGTSVSSSDFSITVDRVNNADFKVESNIATNFHLDKPEVHEIVGRSLLAVGGVNQRIAYMAGFEALTGSNEDDLPMFEGKFDFIEKRRTLESPEEEFHRVIDIAGLPEPVPAGQQIDVGRLLEISESSECREFRNWIRNMDSLSEAEIESMIRPIREKVSALMRTRSVRTARFITSNGLSAALGLIPGVGSLAGLAASAIDEFVVDRLLLEPGPMTFISVLYPSIYKPTGIRPRSNQS